MSKDNSSIFKQAMLGIAGASLDEVWGNLGQPQKPQRANRSRAPNRKSMHPKVYDDIIEAYLDDFQSPCDQASSQSQKNNVKRVNVLPNNDFYDVSPYFNEQQSREDKSGKKCKESVAPILSTDFAEDAMEYQRYFKGDHMFEAGPDTTSIDASHIEQETEQPIYEEAEHMITPESVYYEEQLPMQTPHIYKAGMPTSTTTQFLEMGLYILSGIILIFLMEQILHLGLYLR